jgi:hypothetical protein
MSRKSTTACPEEDIKISNLNISKKQKENDQPFNPDDGQSFVGSIFMITLS